MAVASKLTGAARTAVKKREHLIQAYIGLNVAIVFVGAPLLVRSHNDWFRENWPLMPGARDRVAASVDYVQYQRESQVTKENVSQMLQEELVRRKSKVALAV